MGVIFKSEKRRIIPKWRGLGIAQNSGELKFIAKSNPPIAFTTEVLVDQQQEFTKNKNLQQAGDLLGSAYVLGLEKEFKNVAEFVIKNDSSQQSSLSTLARKILGVEQKKDFGVDELSTTTHIIADLSAEIRKYRYYLKREPRNPLAWIELGRLYTLINRKDKAQKCVDSALFLDSDNRFITRSASRFYHHIEPESDKALRVIKKSKFVDSDPWLMSAEIAYSSILNRFSTMTDKASNFLKYRSNDDSQITELASALGTLEFSNGKIKNAKKLFDQSLIEPNDNSVAQARWMSDDIKGLVVDVNSYHLTRAFEANAIVAYENEEYVKSYENSLNWIVDEPYSTRPVKLAAYITSIFLDNNDKGIEILENGLKINPHDLMLTNNLVYSLARANRIDEATKLFQTKLLRNIGSTTDVSKLTLIATGGLLLYRGGMQDQGRELYQQSISLAKASKNEYLVALATVNYVKEEVKFIKTKGELSNQVNYLNNYIKYNNSPDINLFYNEFLSEYNKLIDV